MTSRRPTIGSAVDHAPDVDEADEIRLTVPALVDYARVVRLAISGLASRNGFAYDDVEDIRIAVGEVFGVLLDDGGDDRALRFSTRLSDEGLHVRAERMPASPVASPSELSEQILGAVVDTAELDAQRGAIALTKRYPS